MFRYSSLALALMAASTVAVADEPAPNELEIIVTAERLPSSAEANPSTIVITRDDIAQRNPDTIADLLRAYPGLDFAPSGGGNSQTSLFLRGAGSQQTLVLIDDIRANSTNTGGFDFSELRPEDIERIEVVRGPYSSRYGSDAIGGVVNIITRRPQGSSVSLSVGNHRTAEAGVAVGAGGFGLRASSYYTQGINATRPNNFSYDPDRDGSTEQAVQTGWTGKLDEQTRLDVHFSHKENRPHFDQGVSIGRLDVASANLSSRLEPNWEQSVQLGWVKDRLDTTGPGYATYFATERRTLAWLHRVTVNQLLTVRAGLDHQHEAGLSTDPLAQQTIFDRALETNGGFLGLDATTGPLLWQLDGRHDHHEQFGNHNTGSLRGTWHIDGPLSAFASYGSAFHAPSLNDLYHPGYGPAHSFGGNPNLKPETARAQEAGFRYQTPALKWEIAAYDTRLKDMLDYASTAPYQRINLDTARLRGVEASMGGDAGALTWQVNGTRQSAKDGNGNDLVRRPRAKGSVYLHWQVADQFGIFQELVAVDTAVDGGQTLSGYGLLNLGVDYRPVPKVRTSLRVDNVLDRDYTVVAGYNTPGITARATLDVQF